jgi:hypothetical protein
MGSITLTVEGTTVGMVANGAGVTLVKEVSEQDSARLIAAYARSYEYKWRNEQGEQRQPTIEEVLSVWWDGVVAGSIAHAYAVEREIAAETARNAFAPIVVTSTTS